jgi:hypothetical protein
LNGVSSCRHAGDFEGACGAGDRKVRMADDADKSGHPTVHVTLQAQHDFFVLEPKLLDHPRFGLADIEAVATRGQAVNVVHQLVAVLDLQRLTDSYADDPRTVDASALLDRDRSGRARPWRQLALQLDERIRQAAVSGGDDGFLDDALARIHLGAQGILAHPDDRIPGQLAHQPDVTGDGPASGLDGRGVSLPVRR